jgi:hypothetical protein
MQAAGGMEYLVLPGIVTTTAAVLAGLLLQSIRYDKPDPKQGRERFR